MATSLAKRHPLRRQASGWMSLCVEFLAVHQADDGLLCGVGKVQAFFFRPESVSKGALAGCDAKPPDARGRDLHCGGGGRLPDR